MVSLSLLSGRILHGIEKWLQSYDHHHRLLLSRCHPSLPTSCPRALSELVIDAVFSLSFISLQSITKHSKTLSFACFNLSQGLI